MNLRGPNIAKESGAMPPSQRLYHGVFDAGHRRAGCCPDPEAVACELLLGITGCAQGVPDLRHEVRLYNRLLLVVNKEVAGGAAAQTYEGHDG